MVYGIDFGTTYTVVSYFDDEDVLKFIKFDENILLPTEKSGVKNLKRMILNKEQSVELMQEDDLLKTLISFFQYIKKEILIQRQVDEDYLNCVLTVPVRFHDFSRYLIKYAAIMAGFNVIKLIQEPVAAAISVINEYEGKNGNYLVYDLGGGTFDVSLIRKHEDIFQVLRVDGLENFGGIDLDEFISKRKNISLEEAEKFKITNYISELDELLEKTYKIVGGIVKNEDIIALILNGGSSYLRNINNHYKGKFNILKGKDLQTLVSSGASIYGKKFIEKSMFLIDVTPFNLGIEVLGDKLEVLIEENSPIPIKRMERFVPVNNKVLINILQGGSLIASECKKLGSISVETDKSFDVTFILDCDGILTVQVLNKIVAFYSLFNNVE